MLIESLEINASRVYFRLVYLSSISWMHVQNNTTELTAPYARIKIMNAEIWTEKYNKAPNEYNGIILGWIDGGVTTYRRLIFIITYV